MSAQATPTLKLIAVDAGNPHVLRALRDALLREVGASEIRAIFGSAYLVSTTLDPSGLRDLLAERMNERDSILVVEFETWSGYGPEIDSAWLMRRGH